MSETVSVRIPREQEEQVGETKSVSVRIPREEYTRLVEIAKERDMLISKLLRRILRSYLSKQKELQP